MLQGVSSDMATVRWFSQARKDLEAITDYYREGSASYAERFEEQIFKDPTINLRYWHERGADSVAARSENCERAT